MRQEKSDSTKSDAMSCPGGDIRRAEPQLEAAFLRAGEISCKEPVRTQGIRASWHFWKRQGDAQDNLRMSDSTQPARNLWCLVVIQSYLADA
jgi:hypothetical protein